MAPAQGWHANSWSVPYFCHSPGSLQRSSRQWLTHSPGSCEAGGWQGEDGGHHICSEKLPWRGSADPCKLSLSSTVHEWQHPHSSGCAGRGRHIPEYSSDCPYMGPPAAATATDPPGTDATAASAAAAAAAAPGYLFSKWDLPVGQPASLGPSATPNLPGNLWLVY